MKMGATGLGHKIFTNQYPRPNFNSTPMTQKRDGSNPKPQDILNQGRQKTLLLIGPHSQNTYSESTKRDETILAPRVSRNASKDLCFRCKAPCFPLHKCPSKSLRAIIDVRMELEIVAEG